MGDISQADVWKSLEGTLVGNLLVIMQSKNFILVNGEIGKDCEIIGEANDFERACITLQRDLEIKRFELTSPKNLLKAMDALCSGNREELLAAIKFGSFCEKIEKRINTLRSLLWESIRSRHDGAALAICKDYKITRKIENDDEENGRENDGFDFLGFSGKTPSC